MSKRIKVPKLEDVAVALGVKCPRTTEGTFYSPSLEVKGVTVTVKREGRGYRHFDKVAIVIETGGYGREQKRRKLYVWKGYASSEYDTLVRRPLTDGETTKLKAKIAEMVEEQKALDEASKARDESYKRKQRSRDALEKALDDAGIDQFGGTKDIEGVSLSIYTDRPKIDITLYDKTPKQVVAIYKAVQGALKEVAG